MCKSCWVQSKCAGRGGSGCGLGWDLRLNRGHSSNGSQKDVTGSSNLQVGTWPSSWVFISVKVATWVTSWFFCLPHRPTAIPNDPLPKWLWDSTYFSTPSAPSLCSLPGFGSSHPYGFCSRLAHHLWFSSPRLSSILQPECLLNRATKHEKGTFDDPPLPQKAIQLFICKDKGSFFQRPLPSIILMPGSSNSNLSIPWIHPVLFLGPSIFPHCLNNYYSSRKSCLNMASSSKSFTAKVRNFSYVLPRQFTNYTI